MKPDKHPFLRLLFPLVAGITAGYFAFRHGISIPLKACIGMVVLACLPWIVYSKKPLFPTRWLAGVTIYMILFGAGWLLALHPLKHTDYLWPEQAELYEVLLLSSPKEKPRSYCFEAQVVSYLARKDTKTEYQSVERKILLYIHKSPESAKLQAGDVLYIRSRILPPRNNEDTQRFDYRSYLLRKGISGTAYAKSWYIGIHIPPGGIMYHAGRVREKLLQTYRKTGMQTKEYGVLAALTLGEKEDLSKDIQQSFSRAGVSHILALSGLHVAFVYILLNAILSIFFRKKWGKARQPIITCVIWGFAFLTGMFAPVLRATVMCSIVSIGKMRGHRTLTLNNLAATAFLMLCFCPLWWFDASFQLSFAAVAGILLWQPWLLSLCSTRHQPLRYIWNIAAVSLAAQLAVLPLILYYFGAFPCYFLITNIAVLGLVSLITYTAFLLLFADLLLPVQTRIGELVQAGVALLNQIVEWVERLPGSYLTELYTSGAETGSMTLAIFAAMHFFSNTQKSRKALFFSLTGVCLFIISKIIKAL